jgi:hypothetical protein
MALVRGFTTVQRPYATDQEEKPQGIVTRYNTQLVGKVSPSKATGA